MVDGWFTWLSSSKPVPSGKPKPETKTKYEKYLAELEGLPVEERITAALISGVIVGSVTTLAFVKFYTRFLRRYPTHEWITPDLYAKKRWIKGIVTSVGDPDGFRLYHTPGLTFVWRFFGIPSGPRALKDRTISIRLAGVDAPEYGHFNKEAQPFSKEAHEWLKQRVLGNVVYCQLLKRDQYTRAVAAVMLGRDIRRFILTPRWGSSLAYEMLRAGLAVTYTDAGAVYGRGGLEGHLAIEAEAKKKKRGQWVNGTNIETPSEYKRRHRLTSGSEESIADSDIEDVEISDAEEAEEAGKKGRGRVLKSSNSSTKT